MAKPVTVRTEGLRDLRRDLRAIDRKLPRELNKALKGAAGRVVVPRARDLAPRRTGRLAASIRAGARGDRIYVRSPLPYAAPIHWGWRARGIQSQPFISRAMDEKKDELVEELGDAVEDLAVRHGFRRR